MEGKIWKTALYIRLSVEDGDDKVESNSVTNQKEMLRDFVSNHSDLTIYDYSISINKQQLLEAIDRFKIVSNLEFSQYANFEFIGDSVTISNKDCSESIFYSGDDLIISGSYKCTLDLYDLETTLSSFKNQFIKLDFGDHQAIVISFGNIKNIIPEAHI